MCGRYGFGHPARLATLPLGVALPHISARYNVAPSQAVPLVLQDHGQRAAVMARWGLIPFWADGPAIGNRLVNARGETAATKPAFRAAFKQRRALLPADLFYEWQVVAGQKAKQPWCIRLPDEDPFCMAALWERWQPKDDPLAEPLRSCCILTTDANDTMAPIHDRMPVILHPRAYAAWLDPHTPPATVQRLVRPYDGPMAAYRVSTLVNAPRHEDPRCAEPLSADP